MKLLAIPLEKFEWPVVLVPIRGWDCVSEKALRFAMQKLYYTTYMLQDYVFCCS